MRRPPAPPPPRPPAAARRPDLCARDNKYIVRGYRPASGSYRRSLRSLGYFHNETVNIWSHLLGAVFFLLFSLRLHAVLAPRYPSATAADVAAFACFFASAATCLGMSAAYHAISNHSHPVSKFGNQLDYLGIVILIVGSFLPILHYAFYCHHHLRAAYWTMASSPPARHAQC